MSPVKLEWEPCDISPNAKRMADRVECSRCDGTGQAEYEPEPGRDFEMGQSVVRPCYRCKGKGWG